MFSARQGGDGISLVAHLNNSTQKQAAEEIAKRAGFDSPSHSPPAPDNLQPLVHLISDHPAIEALGLDFQVAEALGIGFAEKGIMKDRVCFPLRTKEGKLTGYVGYNPVEDPMLKFPTKFFIGEAT